MQCSDANSQPLHHQSPPVTTRPDHSPGLLIHHLRRQSEEVGHFHWRGTEIKNQSHFEHRIKLALQILTVHECVRKNAF